MLENGKIVWFVQWLQSTKKPSSFIRCTIHSRTLKFILKKR